MAGRLRNGSWLLVALFVGRGGRSQAGPDRCFVPAAVVREVIAAGWAAARSNRVRDYGRRLSQPLRALQWISDIGVLTFRLVWRSGGMPGSAIPEPVIEILPQYRRHSHCCRCSSDARRLASCSDHDGGL